jgi:hypothetical protein
LNKIAIAGAWVTLSLICFVTLSSVDLRPHTGEPALERFIAYAVLGGLFMAAYPRHFIRSATLLAIFALGLEALQHLTPDRHGHVADSLQKLLGAWAGCATLKLAQILTERRVASLQQACSANWPDTQPPFGKTP